jgi:4-amino-4-deoxy-L-arabinose transferase-like glycosyltransferase
MKKRSLVFGTAVLLLAAVFRLWQIAELPPGLHSDEAFHLLNAQLIASGQSFPVYITGNNGNEPLFAYLSVISLLILGPVTWAGRLTSAFVGLIGVAATIRLGNEMFPRRGVGWLAGAALATLFWNIVFSRFGIQPILAATAAAATLAALWRGARSGSRWAFALAGVALGLGLDSYVAFRLFAFVPLAAGLALLLAHPARRRALLSGGAVAALGTLLVYSPLALFFIQNPQWFFLRFSETTLIGSASTGLKTLLDSILKTVGGLVLQGDPQWAHNLPGRPALDVPQAAFGALGAGALAGRWRQPQGVTLLVWVVVGLAPSVLSKEAPHFGRAIMVTPALALLVGLGLSAAWGWARGRRAWQVLIVTASLASVVLTAYAYFGIWAHSGALWAAFETEEVDLGRALLAAPRGSRLIAPYAPPHPFTIEYVAGVPAFGGVETFDAANCMLLPTPATEPAALALVNFPDTPVLSRLQAAYPDGAWSVYPALGPGGQPYVGLFQISAGQPPLAPVGVARSADFGGFVRLVGFTVTPDAPRPSSPLKLHVVWQIVQKTETPYKNFIHLLGAPKADGSIVYAQRDSQPCDDTVATTDWTAGDLLAEDTTLDLPADLPPGTYTVQTGWYDSVTGVRAPVTADDGPHANDAAQLQRVVVAQP